jgi:aminodeoxyfutalosine deaminase
VVPKGAPHPIIKMIEAGLNVTINSDDPPMFGTSLTEEYRLLARYRLQKEIMFAANESAANSSFISATGKGQLSANMSNLT